MTIVAFRLDQRRAMAGEWRVPEKTLLMLATLGGWPGAKLAQLAFPHEFSKRAFRIMLNLTILPLAGLAGYLVAQEVDWQGLTTRLSYPAPAEIAEAEVPVAPKKPEVRDFSKPSATKTASVTDNADLPKRIGPGPTKTGAWHSR
ncbi:MAG: DUF1294 domain-containing protein [Cypionkella sp.]